MGQGRFDGEERVVENLKEAICEMCSLDTFDFPLVKMTGMP
jgi:hypothetical protein